MSTMPIVFYNFTWMYFNCLLAFLPVLLGFYFLDARNIFLKVSAGILWLLFLPNTIYIITDVIHIFDQWMITSYSTRIILLFQYTVLEVIGFVCYILAMHPFEELLRRIKVKRKERVVYLVSFNFIIAFGMVLGRIDRLNSWDVLLSTTRVLEAITNAFSSASHLGLIVLFGLFCNFFYFLFKKPIYKLLVKSAKFFEK